MTQTMLFDVPPAFQDLGPRAQLWISQGMCCPICGEGIKPSAPAMRDMERTVILALTCHGCLTRPQDLPRPFPVELASPILRLRLAQGSALDFPRAIDEQDRHALQIKDWDYFVRPAHALWVKQDGCALWSPRANAHRDGDRPLALDFDRENGQLLGVLCLRCRATEGKEMHVGAWRRYRTNPPGPVFAPTRGLTAAYVRASAAVGR